MAGAAAAFFTGRPGKGALSPKAAGMLGQPQSGARGGQPLFGAERRKTALTFGSQSRSASQSAHTGDTPYRSAPYPGSEIMYTLITKEVRNKKTFCL